MLRQRVGIDVVPLERVKRSVEASPERYMARFLTPSESEYCQGPRLIQRLAGRIAAKEAVMKLLGDGWPRVAWTDIEILTSGKRPEVFLSGKALALARSQGMENGSLDVSITHDGGVAIAVAVALFAEDLREEG
ncbi:MAG TPA: holo-ACP synthase [Firmicutes bacterium]|nr:holo-ACP synthase [Candidatus Fermentithermobacillaceae bacterium]